MKRFTMVYPDRMLEDDGTDVEVVFRVPRVWKNAPADGMQAVIAHQNDGRLRVYDQCDIYAVLPNGEPMATDDLGPVLRAAGIAKYGLWIPNQEFEQVRKRIRAYRKQHEAR